MKAELLEYDHGFCLELFPETVQENLRFVRLGMLAKKGQRMYVSVGKERVSVSFNFSKHRNKSTFISQ